MQNDFITGTLHNPDAVAIVPKVKELIAKSEYTLFTRDTHYSNYLQTSEGEKLPIVHCLKGTHGWQIVDGLEEAARKKYYLDKDTFGTIEWLNTPVVAEANPITLVGTCTDVCVITNALILKTLFPSKQIRVKANACAGLSPKLHINALSVMESCQIDVEYD